MKTAVPAARSSARPPSRPSAPPQPRHTPTASRPSPARDGRCACGGTCPRCQQTPATPAYSLRVGPANSPLERAADRASSRVVGPSTGQISSLAADGLGSLRSASDAGATHAAPAPAAVQGALQTPGQALDASLRSSMESHFGRSFADVRIHADGTASAAAATIDAGAYTVGSHIVFGAGRYAPESVAGQRLLAHELAHVVQQNGTSAGVVQRSPWDSAFEPASWGTGGENALGDDLGNALGFGTPSATPQSDGGAAPFFSVNAERPAKDTTTGHAWAALDDGKGKHRAWGFYAACTPVCSTTEYLEIAAGKWVGGEVRNDSFSVPSEQNKYPISEAKYEDAMQLMEHSDPMRYNLWKYNCVDYTRTVAQLFGVTIPDFPMIDEPDELADWIAAGNRGI